MGELKDGHGLVHVHENGDVHVTVAVAVTVVETGFAGAGTDDLGSFPSVPPAAAWSGRRRSSGGRPERRMEMVGKFEVYEVALEMVSALRPSLDALARRDRDLADQVRRASSSVVLNIAEGARRWGKDRMHFYRIAAGSAAEVRAALAVARAWGYLEAGLLVEIETLLDRVLAMLWRLTHGRG